jgi:hypothetical protein
MPYKCTNGNFISVPYVCRFSSMYFSTRFIVDEDEQLQGPHRFSCV